MLRTDLAGVPRLEEALGGLPDLNGRQANVSPQWVIPHWQVGLLPSVSRPSLFFCSPMYSGRKNSRTMLLPLLQRFPEQVRVSLFHTPNLRGLLRLLIPERFNETIGLQHIKVYLFDNNVILSG